MARLSVHLIHLCYLLYSEILDFYEAIIVSGQLLHQIKR